MAHKIISPKNDTAVNVTSDGRPHLGAPVGTSEYVERFTFDKISQWVSEVNTLSSIAISQPHAAYTCFTHGHCEKRGIKDGISSGLLNITCIILTISCKTSVNVLNILKPYMQWYSVGIILDISYLR